MTFFYKFWKKARVYYTLSISRGGGQAPGPPWIRHCFMLPVLQERMQDFSGGGSFKISGILDLHVAKRHVYAATLRAFARGGGGGGFGGMPPKNIFKNGAISCVLRAIFSHFHGKKSFKKIINKNEFFH